VLSRPRAKLVLGGPTRGSKYVRVLLGIRRCLGLCFLYVLVLVRVFRGLQSY
jgi:hypothetical protein